jgi:DNA-binding NtrC family response regulator
MLNEELAVRNGRPLPEITAEATDLLSACEWRGNVRELRNTLEQAVLLHDGGPIGRNDIERVLQEAVSPSLALPAKPAAAPDAAPQPAHSVPGLRPLAEQVRATEQAAIAAAMKATGGNKLAAAKLLGISRAKLYERLPDIQTIA